MCIRDSYKRDAEAWRNWLLRAVAGSPSQMHTLSGVGGKRPSLQCELPYLAGYARPQPVRVGNAAAQQFQLDVYGEVIDVMHQTRRQGVEVDCAAWQLERCLVKFVAEHWQEPDSGIWEAVSYTHLRVLFPGFLRLPWWMHFSHRPQCRAPDTAG